MDRLQFNLPIFAAFKLNNGRTVTSGTHFGCIRCAFATATRENLQEHMPWKEWLGLAVEGYARQSGELYELLYKYEKEQIEAHTDITCNTPVDSAWAAEFKQRFLADLRQFNFIDFVGEEMPLNVPQKELVLA